MKTVYIVFLLLFIWYAPLISQEYRTLQGNKGNINSVAFSPDSKYLASGDENGNLIFWDTEKFSNVYNLNAGSNITSVNYSPSGLFVYTLYNGYVNIMNGNTKEILYNFKKGGHCYFAVYSNDEKLLAVAYSDETKKDSDSPERLSYFVALHETGKYDEIKKLRTGNFDMPIGSIFGDNLFGSYRSESFSCDFSANDKYIAAGSYESSIPIYSFDFGKFIPPYKSHSDRVYFVTFSPDGMYLASASKDETAKIWNVKNGSSIKTLNGHSGDVNSASFSPDSKYLATASDDGTVKIWSVKTSKLVSSLEGFNADVITVKFSPDGSILAGAGKNEFILVWKTSDILPE